MKRIAAIIIATASVLPVGTAYADHYRGDDGNCNREGNCNDQRRCYESDNCRGSFSPGPFDRSPVDIHDNQICISPDCSGRDDKKKQGQQPSSEPDLICTIKNFPYHCDPKPR